MTEAAYFEQFVGDDTESVAPSLTVEELYEGLRQCAQFAAYEQERKVRNREREFARNAGWQGEPYWETADWRELQRLQNAAQS